MRLFERLFLLHTFARFREPAAGVPHSAGILFLCDFLRHFQITGPLLSPLSPQVATLRRVLMPVILPITCRPGSDLPRLRPAGACPRITGPRLLPICLIWLCKFVGMNSSSLLRPAVGYDKIKKRKARDARLTPTIAKLF